MDLSQLTQPPWLYVLIGAAVVIAALVVFAVVASSRRKRERQGLRERFGPEYDRTLERHGSKRAAVADLKERERLHDDLRLNDLNEADRAIVREHMASLQYRFVDDPADVMLQTSRVMTEVLRTKGYPVAEDRDTAMRLFSVDHPAHAGTVRSLLEADHGGNIARMREIFIDVRHTLGEVADISYVAGDAPERPDDLRVEHDDREPAHMAAENGRVSENHRPGEHTG